MLIFWAETPCELVRRYTLEKHIVSIFSEKDGDIMFLQKVGPYLELNMALQPGRLTLTKAS
jgi:hypothetical protein